MIGLTSHGAPVVAGGATVGGLRAGLPYRAVSLATGALLMAAGSLKAYELLTGGAAESDLAVPRWAAVGLVDFEWFFGLWLLLGLFPGPSRRVAIGTFGAFALVALRKAISGEASCGCFGRLAVSPWLTLVADCAAAAALAASRPAKPVGASPGRNRTALATFLTLGFWVGGGWGIIAFGVAADPGRVVLRPEEWAGWRLPILAQIEIGDDLARGDWVVVLYHHDCRRCREELPGYDRRARRLRSRALAPRFALIELPPYSGPGGEIVPADTPCSLGRLPSSRVWVVRTPAEIALRDGVVVPGVTLATAADRPVADPDPE